MHYTDKVELRKLNTVDGIEVVGKRAVVNVNTNRVLGIVSPRYKLIPNTDLLKSITPVLEDLKIDHAKPQVNITKGGAVTFFKFLGDKVTGEVQKGDIVRFGIEFFNSYNGSMPVGFHIVAERLVCTNGLVVPKSITEIHIRHIGDASVGEIRNRLKDYFPRVTSTIDLWKKWVDIKPKETQLVTFLNRSVGKKLGAEFLNKYKNYHPNKQNLWEFYNVLTYYITHQIKSRKEENKIFRQFRLTEKLTNRLSSLVSRRTE